MALQLKSEAFENGETIPMEYTCDGNRTSNPPLAISGIPEGTMTLALIMDDPDVPEQVLKERIFDHWVLFNIPASTATIRSGENPGTRGRNSAGQRGYAGPCPPPQFEPQEHRYFFRLYALDTKLDLEEGASKNDVLSAMEGHVIEKAELMGRYKKRATIA